MTTISGRWPRSGYIDFNDGETKHMNIEAAAFSKPTSNNQLTVRVRVMDEDLFFDDQLGDDAFVFTEVDNFGADMIIHIQDGNNDYRINFSIRLLPFVPALRDVEGSDGGAGDGALVSAVP